jgi:hypothetical protein
MLSNRDSVGAQGVTALIRSLRTRCHADSRHTGVREVTGGKTLALRKPIATVAFVICAPPEASFRRRHQRPIHIATGRRVLSQVFRRLLGDLFPVPPTLPRRGPSASEQIGAHMLCSDASMLDINTNLGAPVRYRSGL